MKKALILLLLAILALIVDGTMTYDIFDFREETRFGWSMVGLAVILACIILLSDSAEIGEDEDTSE